MIIIKDCKILQKQFLEELFMRQKAFFSLNQRLQDHQFICHAMPNFAFRMFLSNISSLVRIMMHIHYKISIQLRYLLIDMQITIYNIFFLILYQFFVLTDFQQGQEMFQGSEYQQIDIMAPQERINLPVSQKSKNRLYLCWRNEKGIQCKMIGPQTKCFCNHRFKQHQYLNPQGKNAKCKAMKCKCKCFDYIPAHGAFDFKCLCKHSYKEHDCMSKTCNKNGCKDCKGFASAWTCSCGSKFGQHRTIVQTYEQRKAKGKSVNDMIRMNEQLNSATQQGSLMKPINIKCDREDRARQKRDGGSMGLIMNENLYYRNSQKKIEKQQDQIEQMQIDSNGYCCGANNKKTQQKYY